jgi:hypothetical protein
VGSSPSLRRLDIDEDEPLEVGGALSLTGPVAPNAALDTIRCCIIIVGCATAAIECAIITIVV